ncbi:MAG: aryl-sulfate sulfotransferase, partial [Bacteroidota bacterium]
MKYIIFFLLFACLPAFSQVPTYTVSMNNSAPKGYYMFAPIKFTQTKSDQFLVDGDGDLVFYRAFPTFRTFDFKKHPNGKVSYFDSFYNYFIVMDSLFNNIDTVKTAGYYTDVHDLIILPSGHYLLMGVETTVTDLSAYHMFKHTHAAGSTSAKWQAAVIQELDTNNIIHFQWHANTHFQFDSADPFWLNDSDIVDWTHSNSLEPDTDGNIIMSSRHFNEITKINRTTGAIMWRFGGKYNQFALLGDTTPFYGQHDARRLKNGHITLFDNGNHFNPHPARALEYELDEEAMTAKLVWSYIYDSLMYSNAMGNVQRLPNKQTLVNYGATNTNSMCFNVVDSLGQEVFNLTFPTGLYSYRSFYYPNMPWAIQRPTVTCFDSLGVLYLKAQSGLSNYNWNTGSSSQIIRVISTGSYVVNVPYGQNAYVLSEP